MIQFNPVVNNSVFNCWGNLVHTEVGGKSLPLKLPYEFIPDLHVRHFLLKAVISRNTIPTLQLEMQLDSERTEQRQWLSLHPDLIISHKSE